MINEYRVERGNAKPSKTVRAHSFDVMEKSGVLVFYENDEPGDSVTLNEMHDAKTKVCAFNEWNEVELL